MKQIHAAKHAPDAHLVKGFLRSHGIAAVIRGEFLTSGWGELPMDVCSVWIEDDRHYVRAQQLLRAFLTGAIAYQFQGKDWGCRACGEWLEGQFTHCWKCGAGA